MPARRAVIGWTAGLIVATAAALLATLGPYGGILLPAAVLIAVTAGRWLQPLLPAVAAIAITDLIGLAIMIVVEPTLLLSRGISGQLAVLFAVAVPWWLGRLRQTVVVQARRERALIDQQARISERSLIAADMHDSLGHELALIALRAGAWELDRTASDRQREAAAAIRDRATAATDRLHVVVDLLRDGAPEASSAQDLEALIDRARQAGLLIAEPQLGNRRDTWSTVTTQAVHRVLQETLTNAAKHAPGSTITVTIEDADDQLDIAVISTGGVRSAGRSTVNPNGVGPANRSGLGLIALDERLRQLGGTFSAEPQRDGFAVRARIPRQPERERSIDPPATMTTRLARRQQRRRVRRSALLPAILALIIAAVLSVAHIVTFAQTALTPDDFAKISIGQRRSAITDLLPPRAQPGPTPTLSVPPAPPDARCDFYLARSSVLDFASDMYRICFTDTAASPVVASKDRLVRQEA
ncbi:sensor histidine kinase [Microlunatus soli]|uniref:histidine kinase n=1 Tax=Microlunatus soli TaxID=630515 RepID=A0A1H1SW55_9ACTN|nr:ATP-binding protein [Microlunatus soli]SDS51956.1 Signal transduction histidine kinase [Microlunatus soli]